MKIPKFRTTTRLLYWVKKNNHRERLSPDHEQVFFKVKKEDPVTVANNIASYSWYAGPVSKTEFHASLEPLLKHNHHAIYDYARMLHNRHLELPEELENELSGDSRFLVNLATLRERRLPVHLEDTIDEPGWAYSYAKEVLHGRLPSHLEKVFFKNSRYASKYAFDIIRGFSSVRLPEDLHSFMIMKSFENPDDEDIKIYIKASESDPSKMNNSTEKV
jgi:hypothetical protein